jgi:hypothetical protein
MSSEHLASAQNLLKGNLAGAWDILSGAQGQYQDLGIARRFGGAAAAYSLRDIGAMNGRVVKVRRMQDNSVEDFSALQVSSGSIEQFAIGQDVLDLYNNAAYFPTDSDYFSLGSGITLSGAFTISYDVVFTSSFGTNTSRIFQDDAGNDLLTLTASDVCKFRVGTAVRTMPTLSTNLQLGRKYSMIFARDASGVYTLTVDGAVLSTTSATDTNDFLIQRMGFRNRGSISNININSGQHIYAGDGAENSNWLDTGSGTTTNATKVGTPVAFTGQGIDAFVDTWYDQSGNGEDMTQGTAGKQPSIVKNGGQVKDYNGNNSIDFVSGSTRVLDKSGTTTAKTCIVVLDEDSSGSAERAILGFSDSTSFMRLDTGSDLEVKAGGVSANYRAVPTDVTSLYFWYTNGTDEDKLFANNVEEGDTLSSTPPNLPFTRIGARNSDSDPYNSRITEVIAFAEDLSADRTVLQNDVNNNYNIF